jgi:hypothetical protein
MLKIQRVEGDAVPASRHTRQSPSRVTLRERLMPRQHPWPGAKLQRTAAIRFPRALNSQDGSAG